MTGRKPWPSRHRTIVGKGPWPWPASWGWGRLPASKGRDRGATTGDRPGTAPAASQPDALPWCCPTHMGSFKGKGCSSFPRFQQRNVGAQGVRVVRGAQRLICMAWCMVHGAELTVGCTVFSAQRAWCGAEHMVHSAWCAQCGAWCVVQCAVQGVHGVVHSVCCSVGCAQCCAWCMVHGARCCAGCAQRGAWCVVHSVQCRVRPAWCPVRAAQRARHCAGRGMCSLQRADL